MSFVANEKSMQRSRHREDDLQALNLQIQQINVITNMMMMMMMMMMIKMIMVI
jgi:hypothetical protein